MKLIVTYETATGRIGGWSAVDQHNNPPDGYSFAVVDDLKDLSIDNHLNHKIELRDEGYYSVATLVESTEEERRLWNIPLAHEVQAAIYGELKDSDITQLPDLPVSAEKRAAWQQYRQALRDLSKQHDDHLDMLRAWPARPDGADPVAPLKARLLAPRF